MKKIKAEIIADSLNERGDRITTFILTYPRFIHAEIMTHRMFSRNAASSRAIPFDKMVQMVRQDPFVPIVWQRDHKGMQGTEYVHAPLEIADLRLGWEECAVQAAADAEGLHELGVTKQLCNRLLEPYLWYTALVTATDWDNFFELRLPKYVINEKEFRSKRDAIEKLPYVVFDDWTETQWLAHSIAAAEPHMQLLAEAMHDAMTESNPVRLEADEWHIPFGDKFDDDWDDDVRVKVAVARCARLSYMTYDGEYSLEKDLELFDKLLKSKHMSPFEHIASPMIGEEFAIFETRDETNIYPGVCRNFRGFVPLRHAIEHKLVEL